VTTPNPRESNYFLASDYPNVITWHHGESRGSVSPRVLSLPQRLSLASTARGRLAVLRLLYPPDFLADDGILFHNPVMEALPTTRELRRCDGECLRSSQTCLLHIRQRAGTPQNIVVPFSMQNQASICCLRPASGLEQKIEFVPPAPGRTFLGSAEPAVTDGFLDRRKAPYVAKFQYPGQRRDRANGRNGHEPLHAFHQERIAPHRPQQSAFRLPQARHRFAAHPQQGPQPVIDVQVRRQQLAEVTNLVQLLLVTIQELAGSAERINAWSMADGYAASRRSSGLSSGGGFCGMIVSFVKPVVEPRSNA
jgi:hypothetical protein